jgi:aerobic-type carbon monoxide dehydrogenase small subunit (CoxS/CutS family)
MFKYIRVRIDGQPLWIEVDAETQYLSLVLRSLGKAGPKSDCGTGKCGACVVMIGDRPVKSCTVLTESIGEAGAGDVWTADHLDYGPSIHPMLAAFRHHGVPPCEACMPGILIGAIAYATLSRDLTEEEIYENLVAEVCRCKFASNMVAAVLDGAKVMHKLRPLDRK